MKKIGICLIFSLLGGLTFIFATPSIENDGLTYYILTKSLARDGDLQIDHDPVPGNRNQLRLARYPGIPNKRPVFSGGYALAYYPFIKWLPRLSLISVPAANLSDYKLAVPRNDALALLTGSLLFGIGSLILTYRLLIRRFDPSIARRTILFLFIGSPLIYYTFSEPSFAHAADTFFLTMALFWMDRSREDSLYVPVFILLAGLSAGFSVTIRNVNAPMMLILGIAGVSTRLEGDFKRSISFLLKTLLFALGMAPFILFQLYYNRLQYGDFLTFGYQVTGVLNWKGHLIPMLFSIQRGLFIWSPLAILSIFGWLLFFRRDRWLCLTAMSMTGIFFATAQFFPHWWGGTSFGLRFATHLFPLLAPGLAAVMERFKKSGTFLAGLLALWTFILFVSFTGLHHSHHGLQALRTTGNRYTPVDILKFMSDDMKHTSMLEYPRKVFSTMAKGYAPAIGPNLASALFRKGTIFVTGIDAGFDPVHPYLARGRLNFYSTTRSPGTFSCTVWPYLDKDGIYRRSGISAIFEVPIILPAGFNKINWTYDTRKKLTLVIPDYEDDVTSRPLVSRAFKNEFPANLHIEMGIFSNEVPRILAADLRRDNTFK